MKINIKNLILILIIFGKITTVWCGVEKYNNEIINNVDASKELSLESIKSMDAKFTDILQKIFYFEDEDYIITNNIAEVKIYKFFAENKLFNCDNDKDLLNAITENFTYMIKNIERFNTLNENQQNLIKKTLLFKHESFIKFLYDEIKNLYSLWKTESNQMINGFVNFFNEYKKPLINLVIDWNLPIEIRQKIPI